MTDAERKRMATLALAVELLAIERHEQRRADGDYNHRMPWLRCPEAICETAREAAKEPE